MDHGDIPEALTFDDVLLLPGYADFLPKDAAVATRLVREGIELKTPFMAAAMDTVTEERMAVAMAREGGIGVIHKNMPMLEQAAMVKRVKRTQSGIITDPVTIEPDATIGIAAELMQQKGIGGLPVVAFGMVVGILTRRDIRASTSADQAVKQCMTPVGKLVSVPPGTTAAEAKRLMQKHRIEKLLVLEHDRLAGLMTMKDLLRDAQYPHEVCDARGRLLVAAAIGVGKEERMRHARLLVEHGVDVLVVDTAHGHTRNVLEAVADIRAAYPDLPIIAGNVATEQGAEALCQAGVSAVKVGMGGGSICTTRVVAGVGVPQMHAIWECAKATRRYGVPLIADGGIKYSGDAVKAFAAGADVVMMGSMLAGTDEAPGDVVLFQGRQYKAYRGMGSLAAMQKGSADRYQQGDVQEPAKFVPEGVQGRVPYRGPVSAIIAQMIGGLKAGMGYTGCPTIATLHKDARFVRQTSSGLRESHPHDVTITEEAPNYRQG